MTTTTKMTATIVSTAYENMEDHDNDDHVHGGPENQSDMTARSYHLTFLMQTSNSDLPVLNLQAAYQSSYGYQHGNHQAIATSSQFLAERARVTTDMWQSENVHRRAVAALPTPGDDCDNSRSLETKLCTLCPSTDARMLCPDALHYTTSSAPLHRTLGPTPSQTCHWRRKRGCMTPSRAAADWPGERSKFLEVPM